MTSKKNYLLWNSLEKLSRIEDEVSLFSASVYYFNEIFPDIEIYYYKLEYERSNPYERGNPFYIYLNPMFKKNARRSLITEFPELLPCFKKREPEVVVNQKENSTTYLYPLCFEKEVQYLVKVILHEVDESRHPISHLFFNIFFNYYYAIRSNERDFLTNMYNRRAFDRVINSLQMENHNHKSGRSDYLALIDIDHFKRINDNYGHMIGDEVLILFSRIIRENVRSHDNVFRTGGEEFIFLFRDLNEEDIFSTCDRIRKTIENTLFPQVKKLTISIGYTIIEYPMDKYFILKKGDMALYYAKENGRNQVFSYEELVAKKKLTPVEHFDENIEIW